jgi:energy-coupling factor transporter ATP-binding protein EcfA2
MPSPLGTPPPPGAGARIGSTIRYARVGTCFIVFNPQTGRYLTLRGRASTVWEELVSGGVRLGHQDRSQPYLAEFGSRGLLDSPPVNHQHTTVAEVSRGKIVEHREFDHLILDEPEIDFALVGSPVAISLPPSNERTLFERIQIRRLFTFFREEAMAYAVRQNMVEFVLQLGPARVLVRIPATNPNFADAFSRSFFAEPWSGSSPVDFTVTVFDDAFGDRSTSMSFDADGHFPLGVIADTRTRPFRVAIDRHTQTVSAYSPEERECVVWIRNFDALPYWSAATPLRLQLSWIADTLGLEFLHSAAVQVDGKAILFAGPSGSGKSTLALSLAGLGFPLISDDFLLSSGKAVQAVYRRLKVHEWSAERVLPEGWRVINEDEPGQKRIVEPARDLLREEVSIGAVVVPHVGRKTKVTRIEPCEAVSAIAPASLSGLLGGNVQSLERIGKLVDDFPRYRLEVSPNLVQNPEALRAVVGEISHR